MSGVGYPSCPKTRGVTPISRILFSSLSTSISAALRTLSSVFFPIPFFIDEQENPRVSEKGDIAFWNARQTICIFYDDMQPLGPTPTFGRITGNLEGFQREAVKVWEKPGTIITLKKKEG